MIEFIFNYCQRKIQPKQATYIIYGYMPYKNMGLIVMRQYYIIIASFFLPKTKLKCNTHAKKSLHISKQF